MTLSLRYAARSDVGLVREGNEDSGYAGPRLLAVADGMGGHAAGEVASSVALSVLAHLDDDDSGGDLLDALAEAVEAAEDTIRRAMDVDPQLEGMGTTLTALLWAGNRVALAHVGDSRAYLLRDGQLTQLTRDHTYVQSLVDAGRISPDEAATHPRRSLLTRALDGRSHAEPDLSVRETRDGDRFLLCSDGLSGVVSEETIATTLAEGTPDQVADRLVELALRGGGPDNVTVVVAEIVDGRSTGTPDGSLVVGAVGSVDDDGQGPSLKTPAGRAAAALRPAGTPLASTEPGRDAGRVRRWRGRGLITLAVLAVLVGSFFAFRSWAGTQYYVAEHDGRIAIYRGIPQDVLGMDLSDVYEVQQIDVSALPEPDRAILRSAIHANDRDDARRIVDALRATLCTSADQPADCELVDGRPVPVDEEPTR